MVQLPLFDIDNQVEKIPKNYKTCYMGKDMFLLCGGTNRKELTSNLSFTYDKGHIREVIEMYECRENHSMALYKSDIVFAVGG